MDALEFAEKVAQKALEDAQSSYEVMHERVYKFATLLAGGAGGGGIYLLGKVGTAAALQQMAPVGALCVWWFLIVGAVLVQGAKSRPLKAGTPSASVRARMITLTKGGASDGDALWQTRWEHLAAVDEQIKYYARGATARAHALDNAYWCVACSPALAGLAYLLATQRP